MEKQVQELKKIIESATTDAKDTSRAVVDRLWTLKQTVDSFLMTTATKLIPPLPTIPYRIPSTIGTDGSGCNPRICPQPIINDLDLFPDITGKYTEQEKLLRCKLASVYRLVDLQGWTYGIYNHITVRVNDESENEEPHFLINPFGMQYNEITASSLLKVNLEGTVLDHGTTNFTFNNAGYVLHSAIHAARPDLKAVIHIHHPACVAVSTAKHGLLMASQEAAIVGEVSYHDYRGMLIDLDEREEIRTNLGPKNRVMILRNHGVVVGGRTVEEAFAMLVNVVSACESQVRMSPNLDQIIQMSKKASDQVAAVICAEMMTDSDKTQLQGGQKKTSTLNVLELEFEARMRMLDYWGLQTGYPYRVPPLRAKPNMDHASEQDDESYRAQLIGLFRKLLTTNQQQ